MLEKPIQYHQLREYLKLTYLVFFAFMFKWGALVLLHDIPYSGLVSFIVSLIIYRAFSVLSLIPIMVAVLWVTGNPLVCFLHGLFVIILDKWSPSFYTLFEYFSK